mmetsp:Transcript_51253/g.163875  ORF Transcript_51253/g.163875 Transcript_51253/m.163875 type:complete len:355 (-) Transcript_51253:17-1081(-)
MLWRQAQELPAEGAQRAAARAGDRRVRHHRVCGDHARAGRDLRGQAHPRRGGGARPPRPAHAPGAAVLLRMDAVGHARAQRGGGQARRGRHPRCDRPGHQGGRGAVLDGRGHRARGPHDRPLPRARRRLPALLQGVPHPRLRVAAHRRLVRSHGDPRALPGVQERLLHALPRPAAADRGDVWDGRRRRVPGDDRWDRGELGPPSAPHGPRRSGAHHVDRGRRLRAPAPRPRRLEAGGELYQHRALRGAGVRQEGHPPGDGAPGGPHGGGRRGAPPRRGRRAPPRGARAAGGARGCGALRGGRGGQRRGARGPGDGLPAGPGRRAPRHAAAEREAAAGAPQLVHQPGRAQLQARR